VTVAATIQRNTYTSGAKVVDCILSTVAAGVCPTFTATKVGTTYSLTSATSSLGAQAAINSAQLVITVAVTDAAGNIGTSLTRIVVADNAAPTSVTAPPVVLATMGADVTLSSFATDNVAISYAAAAADYMGASGGGATSPYTGILPIDFTNSTSSLDAPLASSYTKFLNVPLSLTVSAAPTYLFDITDVQSALSPTTWATYPPSWAVYAAGPGGLYTTAGAMAVNYTNAYVPAVAASALAGMTSGLDIPGTVSPLGAVTVPGAALTTLTSGTFTTTVSYYTYLTRAEGLANGATYLVSRNVCADARGNVSLLSYDAGGVETRTTITSSVQPAAASLTVDAYVKVVGTGSTTYLVKAGGPATKIATATTATTAAPCGGITTETWSYTLNPGLQRTIPLTYPTSGRLHFVAKAAAGHWIVGPAGTWTYTP
jgi:hypothetical protein